MNVRDLAERHVELRKVSNHKGGEYHGMCPGCRDSGHDPRSGRPNRFHVWPSENQGEGSYWCRQCGRGGDAIQFLRDFEGMTFRQACEYLQKPVPDSRDLARRSPRSQGGEEWQPRAVSDPDALWQEHATKFMWWSYERLFDDAGAEAMRYLAGRGIREETAGAFHLGWNPGSCGKDLYRNREAWGLSIIENEKTGRARPLWLPRGLVIPRSRGGRLLGLRIRRQEPRKFGPPYYAVPGSSGAVMVAPPKTNGKTPVYVVVEAELDGILLHQEAGEIAGVVALGSSSTRPDDAAAQVLRGAAHIVNALDFDRSGAKEWAWWKAQFPEAERWPVPEGKDPGEAWQKGVDLREWVLAGLPAGLRGRMG